MRRGRTAPEASIEARALETDAAATGVATRFDGQPLGPAEWAEDGIDPKPLVAASRELVRGPAPRYTRSGGAVGSTTGYGPQALRLTPTGTPAPFEPPAGFAVGVESMDPQPGDCAF